jgi:hypothetical protein
MHRPIPMLTLIALAIGPLVAVAQSPRIDPDYLVVPVSHRDVTIADAFWTPKIEMNRTATIPSLVGGGARGGGNLRALEGVCYSLMHHPDPELQARLDSVLDGRIEAVRRGKGMWSTAGDGWGFGVGNFLEFAVAYHELTGSRKLLDVAIEIADDLDATFGPGKRHDIPNHEGVKIGLIRLYRATGEKKYLDLAQFFIDRRGNNEDRTVMFGPYAQDDAKVQEATRAIGHAVRATYLYTPLADIAALTGDAAYARAAERIWLDAVGKRTYLTGGVGAYRDEEDYGDDYDLPNLSTWNEVCAAYGTLLWNRNMFLLSRDARYIDVLERTLYNGFLVGVSLDAQTYLYQAPLRAGGDFARHESFGPNCCPPNVARLLPQLGGFIYAANADSLYVNLFIAGEAKLKMGENSMTIVQETRYPWDGNVKLTISPQSPRRFALYVRVPGWTTDAPMAGGLYRYEPLPTNTRQPQLGVTLSVNGAVEQITPGIGYAKIEREWKAGDTVNLQLPMPVRRVLADERVADDRGMVALERGPLVYCAEQADNAQGVFNLALTDEAPLEYVYHEGLLGGIGAITGTALQMSRVPQGGRGVRGAAGGYTARSTAEPNSVVETQIAFTAIPYYAFANRTAGEMAVWLARDKAKAVVAPAPSIASTSRATSSVGDGTVAENYPGNEPPTVARRFYPLSQDGSGSIAAIQDQLEPVNSEDGSAPFLRIRPQSGDQAWVQYDFAAPARVSSVEVYWKDDKQYTISPKDWRLLYKDGEVWKPVAASEPFGVAKDRFNRVSFQPVTTAALRIEITLAPKVYPQGTLGPPDGNYLREDLTWFECGLIEWRVNP